MKKPEKMTDLELQMAINKVNTPSLSLGDTTFADYQALLRERNDRIGVSEQKTIEIQVYQMATDPKTKDFVLASTLNLRCQSQIEFLDVEVKEVNHDTGEVTVLESQEFLPASPEPVGSILDVLQEKYQTQAEWI